MHRFGPGPESGGDFVAEEQLEVARNGAGAAGGRQTTSYFPLRQNCPRILGLFWTVSRIFHRDASLLPLGTWEEGVDLKASLFPAISLALP